MNRLAKVFLGSSILKVHAPWSPVVPSDMIQ